MKFQASRLSPAIHLSGIQAGGPPASRHRASHRLPRSSTNTTCGWSLGTQQGWNGNGHGPEGLLKACWNLWNQIMMGKWQEEVWPLDPGGNPWSLKKAERSAGSLCELKHPCGCHLEPRYVAIAILTLASMIFGYLQAQNLAVGHGEGVPKKKAIRRTLYKIYIWFLVSSHSLHTDLAFSVWLKYFSQGLTIFLNLTSPISFRPSTRPDIWSRKSQGLMD